MIKYFKNYILFILIVLCISNTPYEKYVTYFEYKSGITVSTKIYIVSKFSDSTIINTAVGVCYYSYPRKIELLASYWNSSSDLIRKSLILHELGHCEMNRGHFDAMEQSWALSLMRWKLPSEFHYKRCEKEYDIELFTGDISSLLKCIDEYYRRNK
jgi:hypothetical protein